MELVAVGMEVTHDIPDDARALAVGPVGLHARVVHAEEHPAVHRLESVADVGQGAAHDHAHGVVEIRRPHLVRDLDLLYAAFESLHDPLLSPTIAACTTSRVRT